MKFSYTEDVKQKVERQLDLFLSDVETAQKSLQTVLEEELLRVKYEYINRKTRELLSHLEACTTAIADSQEKLPMECFAEHCEFQTAALDDLKQWCAGLLDEIRQRICQFDIGTLAPISSDVPKISSEDFDQIVEAVHTFSSDMDEVADRWKNRWASMDENALLSSMEEYISETCIVPLQLAAEACCTFVDRCKDYFVETGIHQIDTTKGSATAKRGFDTNGRAAAPAAGAGAAAAGSVAAAGNTDAADASSRSYDSLIRALNNFGSSMCSYTYEKIKKSYDRQLKGYHRELENALQVEYNRLDQKLKVYWNQLDQQVQYKFNELDAKCFQGIISLRKAEAQYEEFCRKANQAYSKEYNKCQSLYRSLIQQAENKYAAEVRRCNRVANGLLQKNSKCRELYNKRAQLCKSLSDPAQAENAVKEIKRLSDKIAQVCPKNCSAVEKIRAGLDFRPAQGPSHEAVSGEANLNDTPVVGQAPDGNTAGVPLDQNLTQFKKRNDNLSWEDNLKAVNPNFWLNHLNKNGEYRRNCQRCVMAYEVRRRGYDVTAKERILDGSDTLPTMSLKNGWPSVFKDANGKTPVPEALSATTTADAIAEIKQRMTSYGDGARAIIAIQRIASDGYPFSGHVFIAEQINGKTVFCDPQSGAANAIENFGACKGQIGVSSERQVKTCVPQCPLHSKQPSLRACNECTDKRALKNSTILTPLKVEPSYIRILRIDNLEFTPTIAQCCS